MNVKKKSNVIVNNKFQFQKTKQQRSNLSFDLRMEFHTKKA